MLGIIFSKKKLARIQEGTEKNENIHFYFKLAETNKVMLFFYSIDNIDYQSRKVEGLLYSIEDRKLLRETVNIPKVNLLRTIIEEKYYHVLVELKQKYQIDFINLVPHKNKYYLLHFLLLNNKISPNIPDFTRLSYKNLICFIDLYGKILIKPINGSRGNKIFVFSKENNHYIVDYIYKKNQQKKIININHLYKYYKSHFPTPSLYYIQKWITFTNYEGKKFDIRTSVQKNKNGKWIVTGIVVRIARKDCFVTNIAQGGNAMSFDKIKPLLKNDAEINIKKLSINIAKAIENLYPSIADLGLDIGIDDKNKLWFIEANYYDEKYSFQLSNNLDMWFASYKHPFEFACSFITKL